VLCGLATISEEVDESNIFLKDAYGNYSKKEDNIQEVYKSITVKIQKFIICKNVITDW